METLSRVIDFIADRMTMKYFYLAPGILLGAWFLWFGIRILPKQPIIGVFCIGVFVFVFLVVARIL